MTIYEGIAQYYPLHRIVILVVSLLYLGTVPYIWKRYPSVHYSILLTFLGIGLALFITANSLLLFGELAEITGRVILATLFIVSWAFAVWATAVYGRPE